MWGELMNAEGRSSKPPSRGKGIFPRLNGSRPRDQFH